MYNLIFWVWIVGRTCIILEAQCKISYGTKIQKLSRYALIHGTFGYFGILPRMV